MVRKEISLAMMPIKEEQEPQELEVSMESSPPPTDQEPLPLLLSPDQIALATQNIVQIMDVEGRVGPIPLKCAYCNAEIETEVSRVPNEEAQKIIEYEIYKGLTGISGIASIIGMAVFYQFQSVGYGVLSALISFVMGAISTFVYKMWSYGTQITEDVIHNCPQCKNEIGRNDGLENVKRYKEMKETETR